MPDPKPITELTQGPKKIMIYGPPGAGKTALMATFGEGLEILDIGRGLQTALTMQDQWTADRKKTLVNEFYDRDPAMPDSFQRLKARVFEIGAQCAAKKYPHKCVGVDELTALGMGACRYILFNGGRFLPHIAPNVKTGGMTQPEWGLAMNEVLNIVNVLKSLPVHVIMVAHDVTEDEENAAKKTINVIGRKLAPQLPGYFDEVLHMKVDQTSKKRILQTQPTWDVVARTRSQLPDKFDVDKGMREIFKLMGSPLT
jgi:hypothetical protein